MKSLLSLLLLGISLNCVAQSEEYTVKKICTDSVVVKHSKMEYRMTVLQAVQFNNNFSPDKRVEMNLKLKEALKPKGE